MVSEIQKVAIVTGANKGIGYAIIRGLCEKYDGVVYLTSRNVERGKRAIEQLNKNDLYPLYYQLDIDDEISVNKFRDFLKETYGGIDLLVNNAGILFKKMDLEPFPLQAEETVRINYFGTLRVCEALIPLMRPNGVIINMSSATGHLSRLPSMDIRKKFRNNSLSTMELSTLMNEFVALAKDGTYLKKGWPESPYEMSKIGICALTRIQQREFDNESSSRNLSVNSVHPGYVSTDMTNHKGFMTVEQGAAPVLFLALQSPKYKGKFIWHDNKIIEWDSDDRIDRY